MSDICEAIDLMTPGNVRKALVDELPGCARGPRRLESIDVALAMVERDPYVQMWHDAGGWNCFIRAGFSQNDDIFDAINQPNLPLAICVAKLKQVRSNRELPATPTE